MNFTDYEYSFQATPIILVNGYAGTGMLNIIDLLTKLNINTGIGAKQTNWANFRPVTGHSLMSNEIATYPFANQTTAANAVITAPLKISMEMLIPANNVVTVTSKLSIITSLKKALDTHTAKGGWYNVCTPSYVYTGCLLESLIDASDEEEGAQVQVRWIWNFMQPLLSVSTQLPSQNPPTSNISRQLIAQGDPPQYQPGKSFASNPAANISQNYVPGNSGALGSNIAPPTSSLSSPFPVNQT